MYQFKKRIMMKDKLFAVALCLLLLISGLAVVAQGVQRTEGKNIIKERNMDEGKKDGEDIEKTTSERIDKEDAALSQTKREFISDSYKDRKMSINNRWEHPEKEIYPQDRSIGKWSEENSYNILFDASKLQDNYETHDPIRIDSNEDFAQKADDENWSGNGSRSNPYVIKNYEIDGEGYGYSLYIGNVTNHFEVNECYLYNASGSGVHLFNTSNGKIQNNIVSNNSQKGIYFERTKNNTISNNTIYSNEGHEILLTESDDNKVVNNEIHGITSSDQPDFQDDVEYSKDSILVQVKSLEDDMVKRWGDESALKLKTDEIANTVEGLTARTYPSFNMAEISLGEDVEVKSAVEILNSKEEVINAEPNYLMDFQDIPDDPGYDSLWGMPTIDAPEAWGINTGNEEVVVAVVDTGIDYNHPDLENNIWTSEDGHHGYNAVNDSYYPMDDYGHGTHVAGTIGAVGDNNQGVVGVNWNVSLMGVKIGGSSGLTTANAIAGLEYVLERKKDGENIIATSNSWGSGGYSEILYEAIEQHQEEGISFVAAAGNAGADSDKTPFYPANYDLTNIVSVAATEGGDELASFSNYGEHSVHVGAPGVDINSTVLNGKYGYASGTSMATPHVTGLMALLKSHNSSYNHTQLKNVILSSADHLESLQNLTLTEGRINANQALQLSPDPNNIRFWVHRPTSEASWGESSPISISLNDGVNPILGANVSVEFNTGEDTVYLEDDGSGGDQPGDGYYTGEWTPRTLGEVNLTITAKLDDNRKLTKTLTIEVEGDSSIALLKSEKNVLRGNEATDTYYGISLYTSKSNEITDNLVKNNTYAGLRLHESKNNELTNQTVSNSEYGLLLRGSDANSISNSIISDTNMGMMIQNSKDNTLCNNDVSNNFYGIVSENSIENTIIENEIFDNGFYGMIYYQSRKNKIENNIVESNGFYGIYLIGAENNTLTKNTISNHFYGVLLSDADSNELAKNTLTYNLIGIYLGNSELVTLTENTMFGGGIYMWGLSIEHWNTHSIDTSNTVNGDPVYYWKNKSGGTVSQDAGQVILANCEKVIVKNLDIRGGSVGILAGFSSNSTFKDNIVTNSSWEGITLFESDGNILENNNASENRFPGFALFESKGNKFTKNTASNNSYGVITFESNDNTLTQNKATSNKREGITLQASDGNRLNNNLASRNRFPGLFLLESNENELNENTAEQNGYGLYLALSNNNTLTDNTVKDNQLGLVLTLSPTNTLKKNTAEDNQLGIGIIESNENTLKKNMISNNSDMGINITESSENLIYQNRFIENENQAWDDGDNHWDAGDPAKGGDGGNYWSDYEGKDRGDGIGDTSYYINGSENQDDYPWMTEDMVFEEDKGILDYILDPIQNVIDTVQTIVDTIQNIISIDLPDQPDRREIPGFSFILLMFGLVLAVAIHHKKKR